MIDSRFLLFRLKGWFKMKRKILLIIMMLFSFVSVVYAEEDNSNAIQVLKKIGYTNEEISKLSDEAINQFTNTNINSINSNIKYIKINDLGLEEEITKYDYYQPLNQRSSSQSLDQYVKIIISVEQSGSYYYSRMHVIWQQTPNRKSNNYVGLVWQGNNYTNATTAVTDSTFLNYMDISVRELLNHYTKLARFNTSSGLILSVVEMLTVQTSSIPTKLCGSYYHVDQLTVPLSPYNDGIFPQSNGKFNWANSPSFTDEIFMVRQICLN
jgi:hypothetical protein